MELLFSVRNNYRTYGILLRERNYPTFEGKYNAYVSVYGQLSGDYLGCIETPLVMDINENEIFNPAIIKGAEALISSGATFSIW